MLLVMVSKLRWGSTAWLTELGVEWFISVITAVMVDTAQALEVPGAANVFYKT